MMRCASLRVEGTIFSIRPSSSKMNRVSTVSKSIAPRRVRAELLQRLQKRERLELPREMMAAAEADEEGDLLDAILLVTDPIQWVPPVEARVEGWIS